MTSHSRPYKVSIYKKRHHDALAYCESKGLGLAVWRTEEKYQDMRLLAETLGETLFTALHNSLRRDCHSVEACDSQLVWRQTSGGPEEYFQRKSAYTIPYKLLFTVAFRTAI